MVGGKAAATSAGTRPRVRVHVRGAVAPAVRETALAKLVRAAEAADRPVLGLRLDLEVRGDPALERPAVAKATVDVSGRPVRAHVARPTMDEAVDLLADRLQRSLRRLGDRRERAARRGGPPEPGSWRHGDLPSDRPEHVMRPPEERQLVRRKTYAFDRISPEEAILEMDLLDHDFHLFVDAGSGADCVVHRTAAGPALLSPSPDAGRGSDGEPAELPVEPVPELRLADALLLLDAGGGPFVAFLDPDRGRVLVAYIRHDGHYGVLAPEGEGRRGDDRP